MMVVQPKVQKLQEQLREKGIQPSSPRLMIAQYVLNTTEHPTADEVKEKVEKDYPSVSMATVYNTLNLFVEKGLLKTIRDIQGEKLRYDCNTEPHYHLYDEAAGQWIDLDPEFLQVQPDLSKLNETFEISEIEVTLKGKRKATSPKGKSVQETRNKKEEKNL